MRKIECLNFCKFVHDGYTDVEMINILSEWYNSCVAESCAWIIVAITQAAGQGGGKNMDIYKFSPDIEKEDLCGLILEKATAEVVFTFNCISESFEIFVNKVVRFRG